MGHLVTAVVGEKKKRTFSKLFLCKGEFYIKKLEIELGIVWVIII